MSTRGFNGLFKSILFIVFSQIAFLSGCSSGDSNVTVQSVQDNQGMVLPRAIDVNALPSNGALHAYISVDGGQRQELTVDLASQTVSGTITGISTGSHSFMIEVIFIYDNNTEVKLAEAEMTMDVGAGNNDLIVASNDYSTDFDADGDGVSNLVEINDGRDPLNPADQECVIGTSTIGNCVLG